MAQLPRDIEKGLRQAILNEAKRRGGMSRYRLWQVTGVDQSVIGRFVRGERDLRLSNAAKLAKALGLRLTPDPKHERKG